MDYDKRFIEFFMNNIDFMKENKIFHYNSDAAKMMKKTLIIVWRETDELKSRIDRLERMAGVNDV